MLLTGGDTMMPARTVVALQARERLPAECAPTRHLVPHGSLTGRASTGTYEPAGDQDDRQAILGQLAPPWAAHPASNAHWVGWTGAAR
ncbi:hypothetical protein ACX80U_03740 [Arthrobacter sp. TmT3-37]